MKSHWDNDLYFFGRIKTLTKCLNDFLNFKYFRKNEILYKLDLVIKYLIDNGGEDYKIYECSTDEPDTNILEYALDIKNCLLEDLNLDSDELPFND